MFRNVRLYSFSNPWPNSEEALSAALQSSAFKPCGPLTERSLDSGESRKISGDFDRGIDDVQLAGSSNRLYIQYNDRGKRTLATASLRGEITPIADDVGGVALGRPYVSGGFSTANNGAYAYSAGQMQ